MNRFLAYCVFWFIHNHFAIVHSEKCSIVINEVNIDNIPKPEKSEFIELRSYCDGAIRPNFPTRPYKLVGIRALNNQVPTIDFVVTLWNHRTNENGLYTIGGADITNADMSFISDDVKASKCLTQTKCLSEFFIPNANDHLRAIALLKGQPPTESLPTITLSRKKPSIVINREILELLNKVVVDMVVYGRRAPSDSCSVFEDIYSEYTRSRKYVLRDFDVTKDRSINRCSTQTLGFIPEDFKLGQPTPGQENDCTGPHFILEDHILDLTHSVKDRFDYERYGDDEDAFQSCSASIPPSQYYATLSDKVDREIQTEVTAAGRSHCTPLYLLPDAARMEIDLSVTNERKRRISDDADYSEDYEWSTTKYFK